MTGQQTLEVRSLVPSKIALVVGLLITGCGEDPPPPPPDGGETTGECEPEHAPIELEHCGTLEETIFPDAPCGPCHEECHLTYFCFFADGSHPEGGCPICAENELAATAICQSTDFLDDPGGFAVQQPCNLPISCTGWDPDSEVTGAPPTVDDDFLNTLIANPDLMHCDSARFAYDVGEGAFVLSGAVSGGLLYELGFRNGDIPVTINSLPVQDAEHVALAFAWFYLTEPNTYSIKVDRGVTPYTEIVVIVN